jgi:hypothetical protein
LITEISDKYVGHSVEVLCRLIIFVRLRWEPMERSARSHTFGAACKLGRRVMTVLVLRAVLRRK